MSNDEFHPYVNFASPTNRQALIFLRVSEPDKATVYTPKEVDWMHLGTHPDLTEYLWSLLKENHPECACVINKHSAPLLVHQTSGIIFALGRGTSLLAMRLPEPERTKMLAIPGYGAEQKFRIGNPVRADEIGEDWVLLKTFDASNAALCQKAYDYAGTLK